MESLGCSGASHSVRPQPQYLKRLKNDTEAPKSKMQPFAENAFALNVQNSSQAG